MYSNLPALVSLAPLAPFRQAVSLFPEPVQGVEAQFPSAVPGTVLRTVPETVPRTVPGLSRSRHPLHLHPWKDSAIIGKPSVTSQS